MLASRVRRVRHGLLRLRHDWWFRWAHDPLCERLGGGVLTIGKLRLCRSCVAMYSGTACGLAVTVVAPGAGAVARFPAVWLGGAGAAAAASVPPVYAVLPRSAKDGVRFGTGVLAGLLPALGRAGRWRPFVGLVAVAATGYRVLTLARADAKASACDGCPELDAPGPCSGYEQQVVALRGYEEAASELAMRERARQFGQAGTGQAASS